MKLEWLLDEIEINDNSGDKRLSLSYNSPQEEAVKLALKIRKLDTPLIVIKENNYLANRLKESLYSYFDEDEVITYLPEESLRAEEIASSYENRANRLLALYKIITSNKLKVVIVSPYGYIRHLPNKDELSSKIIKLKINDTLNKETLIAELNKLGYEKTNRVENPMSYASRGYIVDVFSVNYDKPLRIEFFDDIIDSIRFFDINSQSTIERIDEADIIFAKDVFFSDEEKTYLKENVQAVSGEMELNLEYIQNDIYHQSQYYYYTFFKKSHLKDYFNKPIIYLSDKNKIDEHLKILSSETVSYIQEMYEEKRLPARFYVYADFNLETKDVETIKGEPFKNVSSLINPIDLPYGNIDYLVNIIDTAPFKYKLLLLSDKEAEDVINALVRLQIPYNLKNDFVEGINIQVAYLDKGYEVPSLNLAIYSSKDFFKEKSKQGRFVNKFKEAVSLNSYEELKPGDYVVHDQYGIGQYQAIETKEVNGISLDYLKIIYKGNDVLLVPLNQFKLVRKYVSKEGVIPKLHKLGSREWIETKRKVEENVNNLAEKLVKLYASREEDIGFAYSKDTILHKEFADEFPFELTDDQAQAIEEVNIDMESKKPMDRLLCGDVGFGKTEVAIRAAFKAVYDHKQVAYLCPTTVLSLQHYNTFKKRFENFPIKVKLLNRYVSDKEAKETIKGINDGDIEILVGTHRILSRDLKFKDLGLLIIDEEQRFGVEHKEKIKELKNGIDVLSLSATPIPRTLQMSLIGIRGLSTLNTPPDNRYPVQTYITFKNDNLIKEIILRELERNGQVFYLYNNVDQIYRVAKKISKEIPYANVAVVHGKMNATEIEDAMVRFYRNEINVLICTTIIETGLDIPNANTIIIDNAQNFGLSQLYQIKGRVGRSDKVAYAYLMIPEKKELNESASKRLEAIKEFTSLGSGYKIAMRDLTIRGAGDLLGPKQSGFIDNVGLDLYLSMLNNAIKVQRGEEIEKEEIKPNMNIQIESYIPEGFNDNDYEKLAIYHKLDEVKTKEELFNFLVQTKDEYGKLPQSVNALFEKKKLELLVNLNYIESISKKNNHFIIRLTNSYSDNIDGLKLFELTNSISKDIVISYRHNKLEFSIESNSLSIEKLLELIDNLDKVEKCV